MTLVDGKRGKREAPHLFVARLWVVCPRQISANVDILLVDLVVRRRFVAVLVVCRIEAVVV